MDTAKPIDKSKYVNDTTFKKGDNRVRKPKGAISKKTKLAQTLGLNFDTAKQYMVTTGLNRFVVEMEALNGRDYAIAYLSLLEYFKPKLARQEIAIENPNEIIQIFGKQIDPPANIIELSWF